MVTPDNVGGTHAPTRPAQDLLLRATFLPGDRGLDAWQRWRSTIDLDDHLDLGSYRLLPELCRRLRQRGVDDSMLEKFGGIAKKHWLTNRLFIRDLEAIVKALRGRDIRVMLPAGVTLALLHYPDHPLEPALNHALIVETPQAAITFGALEAAGWTATPRLPGGLVERYVSARTWHTFEAPNGARLRVHWRALAQRATRANDRDIWSRATEWTLGEEIVAIPHPTDQLVQLCAQRVATRVPPLFVRAADVMMLLSACRDEIDWTRLTKMASEPGLILPVRDTLSFLQARLDEPVPAGVFAEMCDHRVSSLERLEYELTAERPSWLGDLLGVWMDYRRSAATNLPASVLRFPRFVQHYLRLDHLWQTPFRVLAGVAARLREQARETVTTHPAAGDGPTARR